MEGAGWGLVAAGRGGVGVVPEAEGDQRPERAAGVLAAGQVALEQGAHGGRLEEALGADARGGEQLAGQRQQRAAQPGRRGGAEAALGAAHDRGRQQRRGGRAQQRLGLQPAHPGAERQRVRELGHERVEVGHADLQAVGHPGAVGLGQQVVGQERPDVDVLQARDRLGALGLGVAAPVGVERVLAAAAPR